MDGIIARFWGAGEQSLHVVSAGLICFRQDRYGFDQLAAFDAHPANVLKDRDGVILPIDLILVEAGDALAAQLEAALL